MDSSKNWREELYVMVFQSDTKAGRRFDGILLLIILASIVIVMLDSIDSIHQNYANVLAYIEWGFTVIFAIEYGLRCTVRPSRCATRSASMDWWICWRSCPAFLRCITPMRSTC
jgi:hypothetical protein